MRVPRDREAMFPAHTHLSWTCSPRVILETMRAYQFVCTPMWKPCMPRSTCKDAPSRDSSVQYRQCLQGCTQHSQQREGENGHLHGIPCAPRTPRPGEGPCLWSVQPPEAQARKR